MKKTILKISLLFVALCMCVSLAACGLDVPNIQVRTTVNNCSVTYDEQAKTSNVSLTVQVENNSADMDVQGFSYTIRFYTAEGVCIYSELVDCTGRELYADDYILITEDYTVRGNVGYAEVVPYSATVIPVDPEENESDSDSEGCSGDCSDGSWFTNLLLIGGGLYLAWKLFIED